METGKTYGFCTPTALMLAAMFLNGCSAGSGGGASEREVDLSANLGSSEFIYDGPPPASDEIQSFKRSFYDPLAANDRCGECHTPGKNGSRTFVDQRDVNNAWSEARALINTEDPSSSAVVQRVASGHNCWLEPTRALPVLQRSVRILNAG